MRERPTFPLGVPGYTQVTNGAMPGPIGSAREIYDYAPDVHPYIKFIASLVLRILEIAQEVKTKQDECKGLAQHAEQIVVYLARGQANFDSNNLELDLFDVKDTIEEVLRFVEAERKTGRISGWIRKEETNSLAEVLDKKLDESYRVFMLKTTNEKGQQHYGAPAFPTNMPPPYTEHVQPVTGILEGIFEIVHLPTNTILEMGNDPDSTVYGQMSRHIYFTSRQAPRSKRHLWAISRKPRTQGEYWIRSLYNGLALNLSVPEVKADGSYVCGWPFHGLEHQTWEISRKQAPYRAFTIRSLLGQTALDTQCPTRVEGCTSPHTTPYSDFHRTQEWDLVLYRARPPPLPGQPVHDAFFLKNKHTGCYLTQMNETRGEPNITGLPDATISGLWTFMFTGVAGHTKTFAIFSAKYGTTLDHYGGAFLNSWRVAPDEHFMHWEVIPYGDKSVILRNQASRRLLCHRQSRGAVETLEPTAHENPACHWQVFQDAEGPRSACIVYDNLLSDARPLRALELAGYRQGSVPVYQGDHTALEGILESDYGFFSELAEDGYDAFVVGPQEVDAGRRGKWRRLRFLDVAEDIGHVRSDKQCF